MLGATQPWMVIVNKTSPNCSSTASQLSTDKLPTDYQQRSNRPPTILRNKKTPCTVLVSILPTVCGKNIFHPNHALTASGKNFWYDWFSESMAAANFMRSMSHMSSDSEHEETEFERKLSARASRRLSAKKRPGSAFDRQNSSNVEVCLLLVVWWDLHY